MRRFSNTILLAVLASPLAATTVTLAQNAPRDPDIGTRTQVWPGYIIAGVFAAILISLTLFPSKRQPEDL
jgi:hypothetical protein